MSNVVNDDVTCGVFTRLSGPPLDADRVHRFVVGVDTRPQDMTDEEVEQLGDAFATLLLKEKIFPRTAREVFAAFDEVTPEGHPLRTRMFFFLGEGSQIPFTPATDSVRRNLRFLATAGPRSAEGPDVLISVFHPDAGDVELMAWDDNEGGFNYYRTVGEEGAWVFAGNSAHALVPPSEGKGPFESHTSGAFLMKELRAPWVNWHSPDAPVQQSVFAPGSPLRDHPWFTNLEPLGAVTCENAVARPSIIRWVDARFAALLGNGNEIEGPERIMRQILGTPTVNLICSKTEGATGPSKATVDLPQAFFVDSEALTEILKLSPPPPFGVSGAIYAAALDRFDYRVTDGGDFTRPGDTHFAFVVPERAFEDVAVVRKAIEVGLLSERFAGCLLMTDFPNPVFSERRAQLLRHVPASATVSPGGEQFSEAMAELLLAEAEAAGPDSPEAEFAALWTLGEQWRDKADELLSAYFAAVQARLATQAGFDDFCRLADSRRDLLRAMPIFENRLLLPETNIPTGLRSMRPDATVVDVVVPDPVVSDPVVSDPIVSDPVARQRQTPEEPSGVHHEPRVDPEAGERPLPRERRPPEDPYPTTGADGTRGTRGTRGTTPARGATGTTPAEPERRRAPEGVLPRFGTPAGLPEPTDADRDAWSDRVAGIFAANAAVQVYNPTVDPTPAGAQVVDIVWTAFPARLLQTATSQEGRWGDADDDREQQDEYCEWSVERNADGKIVKVTFTAEVPEYFEHLAGRDPARLLAVYRELVGPQVAPGDLVGPGGSYNPRNQWNTRTDGPIVHLVQTNNTLGAAVGLVSAASVPRKANDGTLVTTKQALARCAGLGNEFRNSDPQIATVVNSAAREGDEVTLLDPVGLYIDGITTSNMVTPDGADPATFWTIERGDEQHILRARFEVPAERGYTVSDVVMDGRPITFGAQLADRVNVRISAIVKPADHNQPAQACGAP